ALLDYYLKDVELVPLVIGQISKNDVCEIAMVIADSCSPQTLIILSADIAYYQNCYQDCPLDQSKICKIYDQDTCKIQAIQSNALQQQAALFNDPYKSSIFALLFELLQVPSFTNLQSYFVGYGSSYSHVDKKNIEDIQTYASFVFEHSHDCYKNILGLYEQSQLLHHARIGLTTVFEVPVCREPYMISYEMAQQRGVFASLYMMSDHGIFLQGCIGRIESKLPLCQLVYQMAKEAAYNDLRFYPLRYQDLGSTIISLSVVKDVKNISKISEIQEFDGIMLQFNGKTAISLPVTTPKDSWDYKSILINLSQQIGACDFLWKKPQAKIFTFHSLMFQEE
ncbi:MAG: AmmeMemoRadiSam system protein B, partial [Candidatus Dependentiae bacterium]|nr:AmmeMemoRadiSam system protein B [Candidatus Dependentiae bacterium]